MNRDNTQFFLFFFIKVFNTLLQIFPPLPPSPATKKPQDNYPKPSEAPSSSEAILISILTAFLLAHPLGVSIDYIVSYVRSMLPDTNQTAILSTLQKYKNIFNYTTKRYGASLEYRWSCVTFDTIKDNSRWIKSDASCFIYKIRQYNKY